MLQKDTNKIILVFFCIFFITLYYSLKMKTIAQMIDLIQLRTGKTMEDIAAEMGVKQKFNTDVEMYTLKHMNSTYIAEKLGDEAAAKMNSHTTTGMVINVYDINRMSRMHQFLKDVDNSFSDN